MSMHNSLFERILSLEESLLQPAVRSSPAALAELLADDFIEFGSSGKIYSQQQLVDLLPHETEVAYSLYDFQVRELAPAVVLATYRTTRTTAGGRQKSHALRSSIWGRTDGRWRLLFHQGTPTTA